MTKRNKFQLKRTSIQLENYQTVSHKNEPSFNLWQWWIKNSLEILSNEFEAQIYAITQYTQEGECLVKMQTKAPKE